MHLVWYFHMQQEEQAEENCCNLKDLREGLIGKMLVRKSGRVQLILGQVTLDVSLGTSCSFFQVSLQSLSVSSSLYLCVFLNILFAFSFLPHPFINQELVSVGTDGRAGDLSVLGTVKHKMVCSPDFEALLENLAWSKLNMADRRLHELPWSFNHNQVHSVCILCFSS